MALKGLKVIEMAGLAPAPMCGMILSDFGADVIRVDKIGVDVDVDRLSRGKRSISVDLRSPDGVSVVRKLCRRADVLIEPYRRGVMERLGLGAADLLARNRRLVYARLTGFGQDGPLADRAGHDINFLALSGVLSTLGRRGERPHAPVNLLADFAGGAFVCALGISVALFERERSGSGQVVDASMVEGAAYVGSWLWRSRDLFAWGQGRGENLLDGGSPVYDTYETKDGKYVAVGPLEPQFYRQLVAGLELSAGSLPRPDEPEAMRRTLVAAFRSKTRDEWCRVFDSIDACVTPVLSLDEAGRHPHNEARQTFIASPLDGVAEPGPAPRLDRTPASRTWRRQPTVGQHSKQILAELGLDEALVDELIDRKVVYQRRCSSKL